MTCTTMMTLKGHRQFLVSNRLALLAGLALAVMALAGPANDLAGTDGLSATVSQDIEDVRENREINDPKRKLNVRFLLFRHG